MGGREVSGDVDGTRRASTVWSSSAREAGRAEFAGFGCESVPARKREARHSVLQGFAAGHLRDAVAKRAVTGRYGCPGPSGTGCRPAGTCGRRKARLPLPAPGGACRRNQAARSARVHGRSPVTWGLAAMPAPFCVRAPARPGWWRGVRLERRQGCPARAAHQSVDARQNAFAPTLPRPATARTSRTMSAPSARAR